MLNYLDDIGRLRIFLMAVCIKVWHDQGLFMYMCITRLIHLPSSYLTLSDIYYPGL
jgi:hypothetical protein